MKIKSLKTGKVSDILQEDYATTVENDPSFADKFAIIPDVSQVSQPPPRTEVGAVEAAKRAFLGAALYGGGEKTQAGLRSSPTIGKYMDIDLTKLVGGPSIRAGPEMSYEDALKAIRERNAQAREDHPIASMIGSFGGSMSSPSPLSIMKGFKVALAGGRAGVPLGSMVLPAAKATFLEKVGKAAAEGGIGGAAQSLGGAEDWSDPLETAKDVGLGTAVGAGGGAVLQGIGSGLVRGAKWLGKDVGPRIARRLNPTVAKDIPDRALEAVERLSTVPEPNTFGLTPEDAKTKLGSPIMGSFTPKNRLSSRINDAIRDNDKQLAETLANKEPGSRGEQHTAGVQLYRSVMNKLRSREASARAKSLGGGEGPPTEESRALSDILEKVRKISKKETVPVKFFGKGKAPSERTIPGPALEPGNSYIPDAAGEASEIMVPSSGRDTMEDLTRAAAPSDVPSNRSEIEATVKGAFTSRANQKKFPEGLGSLTRSRKAPTPAQADAALRDEIGAYEGARDLARGEEALTENSKQLEALRGIQRSGQLRKTRSGPLLRDIVDDTIEVPKLLKLFKKVDVAPTKRPSLSPIQAANSRAKDAILEAVNEQGNADLSAQLQRSSDLKLLKQLVGSSGGGAALGRDLAEMFVGGGLASGVAGALGGPSASVPTGLGALGYGAYKQFGQNLPILGAKFGQRALDPLGRTLSSPTLQSKAGLSGAELLRLLTQKKEDEP